MSSPLPQTDPILFKPTNHWFFQLLRPGSWLTPVRQRSLQHSWEKTFEQRPLIPVALAYTAGVLLARWEILSLPACALIALGLLIAPQASARGLTSAGRSVWLVGLCALAGTAWYWIRTTPSPHDIRSDARPEGRIVLVRLRVTELHTVPAQHEPLRSWQSGAATVALATVESLYADESWLPRSGTVRVRFQGEVEWLAAGDRVEVLGELVAVLPPGNPGEDAAGFSDYARGLSARLQVRRANENCRLLESARWYDLRAHIARMGHSLLRRIHQVIPEDVSGLTAALLLGELSNLSPQFLKRYQYTGIIHVLAISGQHLVLVSAFVLWVGRFFRRSPRQLVAAMILILWFYTCLTGARPATVRSAVMVSCWCLGLWLLRPAEMVNSLCLAWLVIGLWQPLDWFTLGCQLSFLASLVLATLARWLRRWIATASPDPFQRLYPQSLRQWLGRLTLGWLRDSILASAAIWLTLAPWLAAKVSTVAIASIWLTPLVVPCIALALLAGIAWLVLGYLPLLGNLLVWGIIWPLRTTEWILSWAEQAPLAYFFTPGPPAWWLAVFYIVVLAWLLIPGAERLSRSLIAWLAGWLILGWFITLFPSKVNGLLVTVLDVGHGGCVVIETPDDRTWLYDAGSLYGPEIAERVIAPYLWHRCKRRIDAVVLSHGDLDHYNGVPHLAKQFRIGAVYVNPSFWDKSGPGYEHLRQALQQAGVAVYRLDTSAGRFTLGSWVPPHSSVNRLASPEPLRVEVLHPPPQGPPGPENARSLVLLLQWRQWKVLLTGDLQDPGLQQVLPRLPQKTDVLLAPHHGSPRSNTLELAHACRPGLVVVACDRRRQPPSVYQKVGATVWETWREGAVRIAIDGNGLRAETYRSGKRWTRGAPPD